MHSPPPEKINEKKVVGRMKDHFYRVVVFWAFGHVRSVVL